MRKYEYNHVLVARNRLFNLYINHFLTSLGKILRIYKSNYLTNYNDSEEVQEMKLASIYMKNPNPSFSFHKNSFVVSEIPAKSRGWANSTKRSTCFRNINLCVLSN